IARTPSVATRSLARTEFRNRDRVGEKLSGRHSTRRNPHLFPGRGRTHHGGISARAVTRVGPPTLSPARDPSMPTPPLLPLPPPRAPPPPSIPPRPARRHLDADRDRRPAPPHDRGDRDRHGARDDREPAAPARRGLRRARGGEPVPDRDRRRRLAVRPPEGDP